MRLIDADDYAIEMNGVYPEYWKEVLDDVPTIEAEPVVRCKDCISYGTSISGVPYEGYCKQLEYTTRKDDDFCSWGRRKNEAD